MKIYSNNEWAPLKEVIVGNTFGIMNDKINFAFEQLYNDFYDWGWLTSSNSHTPIKQQYIDELNVDLAEFIDVLHVQNIIIHRPTELTELKKLSTPDWQAAPLPALNVRDQALILGNTIVETPPMLRHRYFENDMLKPIFYNGFNDGARWTCLPKNTLSDNALEQNNEMLIDAAQFVRFGDDVIVNVQNESHSLAVDWFEREFPNINFHRIQSYIMKHLDGFVVPLCEGVLMLRDESWLPMMPAFLKDWKIVYSPVPASNEYPVYDENDSVEINLYTDMNLLSLDGNKIVCNALFPEMAELLYKEGFEPLPIRHRHRRIVAGGFHCFTLDIVREK